MLTFRERMSKVLPQLLRHIQQTNYYYEKFADVFGHEGPRAEKQTGRDYRG